MSDTRKFGTWLLDQSERQDTTGTLARAWQHLRDANGHVRQTSAKAIGELMKGALGEDWDRLRGDESMAEAVKEWERRNAPAGSGEQQVIEAPEGYTPVGTMLPGGSVTYDPNTVQTGTLVQPAVLVMNGAEYLLEPGKRYELSFVSVSLRDEQGYEQPHQDALTRSVEPIRTLNYAVQERAASAMLADGRTDWAALWGMADHTVPQSDGYLDEE